MFDSKNKLYNYICGILVKKIEIKSEKIEIIVDKKDNNTIFREDFNNYIERKIKEKHKNVKVGISHIRSQDSVELQAIDFIPWSISRKYSYGDDFYYKIIEHKIKNKDNELIWKN